MKRRLLIGIVSCLLSVAELYADAYSYIYTVKDPVKGGTVEVSGSSPNFTLTARPSFGWTFKQWSDDNTSNPRNVTANGDGTITYSAVFEYHPEIMYSESHTDPAYGGTVSAALGACDWVLTATPATGYRFIRWSDGNTDNPRHVTADPTNLSQLSVTYTADFMRPQAAYGITNTETGSGGTVEVTISNECENEWELTAVPESGWAFYQWNDGNTENPRTVNLTEDDYVYTASFTSGDVRIGAWQSNKAVLETQTLDLDGDISSGKVQIYANGTQIGADQTLTKTSVGKWTFPASLNDYNGKALRLLLYDACDNLIAVLDTVVPFIVTAHTSLSGVSVNSKADVQVLQGTLTVDVADATIGKLDIYPDAKVVVPSGNILRLSGLTMRADGTTNTYPQLVANGSILNANNDTIYYDYTLNYAYFYPLAVPYTVPCSAIRTADGRKASFEIQWYSGADRAANVSGWNVLDDQAIGAQLNPGTGYITFAVPPKWNGTRQSTVAVRFPMKANLNTGEPEKGATVNTYGDAGTNESNKNWNLIGNPYLGRYTHNDDNKLLVGHYEQSGESWELVTDDNIRYVTTSTDGFQTYSQTRVNLTELKAFNVYFIQTKTAGEAYFTFDGTRPSAPARYLMAPHEPSETEKELGISLSSADRTDYTGILYGPDFSPAYELNADLAKMFGNAVVLQLYTLAGGEKRAFNALALSDTATAVPLGYRDAPTGELTFAFDFAHYDAAAWDAVWLTDYVTGTMTNLLVEPYTFINSTAHNEQRFALWATPYQPKDTPTDVDSQKTGTMQDGIYDLLGRRMRGGNRALAPGVYVIIRNGESRKEVIR